MRRMVATHDPLQLGLKQAKDSANALSAKVATHDPLQLGLKLGYDADSLARSIAGRHP